MHDCPYDYIADQEDVDIYVGGQQYIACPEEQGDSQYDYHAALMRETQANEFVMDMVHIGFENMLAFACAVQHHPYHIEHGHYQQRESDDDRVGKFAVDNTVGFVAAQLDGKYRKSIPITKAPPSPMNILRPFSTFPKTLK